jgi:hypothetical protein
MNVYVSGFLWVAVVMIAAAALAVLLRRRSERKEGDQANNEAAGQVFTIVAGVNVVVAAFVLISLYDAIADVEETTYAEADALVAVYWASHSLPEPARTQIQREVRTYATVVAEREWPEMRAARPVGDTGWDMLNKLRTTVDRVRTTNDWQEAQRTEAATQLWNVYQARQERLNASGGGISAVVWFAILVGSLMSVALVLLFGGAKLVAHAVIVSVLAGAIGLLLFAIYQLQNPFSGGADVGPDAFTAAVARFGPGR